MSDTQKHDPIAGEIIHEYDGIEEADNQLPHWWLWIFYTTIAFSVLYWFHYHTFANGDLPMQQYAKELTKEAGDDASNELLIAMTQDHSAIEQGRALFVTHCKVCHQEDGGGNVGPNLTDAYWIHGGEPTDIYKVVRGGVSGKMPSWGPTLGAESVRQLTSFVLSIRNTNVAGKPPQGEPWKGQSL